ncbi:MAG: YdeI/OmpD-associated family protein [Candidatus Baltobacteraceae bacterium]
MQETREILSGVLHEVPADIAEALISESGALSLWNALTPIQRNEWICWTTIVKKPQTRVAHIDRLIADLREGKRQPCCWPGCPHRRPNAKKWLRA